MSTAAIITTACVLAALAFFIIKGYIKGFLRILFTTFSLVVTIAISSCLTTPFATFLEEKTSIGNAIETRISEYIDSRFEDAEEENKEKEEAFIESLALPSFIKTSLSGNNTLSQYRKLGISSFKEYITAKLTSVSINALAFILLGIATFILLRVIFHILKLITRIPLLRGINRLFGAILGLVEGMLILWGICVIIMIFSASDVGVKCMEVINESRILSFIYNNNLMVTAANSLIQMLF